MAHEPLRTCCVCRQKKCKKDLLRFTLDVGQVKINEGKQKIFGRSAYVCKCEECLTQAIKKRSLNRAFKREVPKELYEDLTKYL